MQQVGNNSGTRDRARAETSQLERMRTHVAYLLARSPWYADTLATHGVCVDDLRTWKDLQALPFTTKDELAQHNAAFRCVPQNRIVEHVFTSGSTGAPVPFGLSENDLERLARNEAASLTLAGVTSDDVVQITTTLDKRFMAGIAYWLGLRRIGAGVLRNGPGNTMGQWEMVEQCGSTVLIVVPSFLLRMLQDREKAGKSCNIANLRKAICIGEPIADAFGRPNLLAQRIASMCDLELVGTYASTEMATACTEAIPFGGHVVPQELMLIEVLDEHDRPVPEGGIGEVVATPWHVEAMPLLRFRTGDICSRRNEIGPDGARRELLGPVIGRKAQRMKVKGTSLYPQQVIDALHAEPGLNNFMVLRELDEHGFDVLRILVDVPDHDLHAMSQRLGERLRVTPILEQADTRAIEAVRHDPKGRKPTLFIDKTNNY